MSTILLVSWGIFHNSERNTKHPSEWCLQIACTINELNARMLLTSKRTEMRLFCFFSRFHSKSNLRKISIFSKQTPRQQVRLAFGNGKMPQNVNCLGIFLVNFKTKKKHTIILSLFKWLIEPWEWRSIFHFYLFIFLVLFVFLSLHYYYYFFLLLCGKIFVGVYCTNKKNTI